MWSAVDSERQNKSTRFRIAGGAAAMLIMGGLLAGWIVGRAGAQAVPEQKGVRPLLFLGNQSLPPMSYLKSDEPAGVVVDLARALAKRMDRPVQIRLMNWSEAQRQVLDGQADALLQINSSPERLKIYDFSEPLLSSEFTIFTVSQRQGIASMEDLRGLKVGVEEKGLPISLLKQDPQISVEIIPDFAQGLRMLTGGGLDAVVADRWVGSYVLAENDIRGVKLIDSPISRSHSAIAVKKGNRLLLDAINQALAGIREDGTYDRIIHSWESKEIVFKTREQLRQQAWLFAAISAILVVALAGIALLVREIRGRKHVEAKLAAALASMADAVFISDVQGRFVDFNSAFATFHRFENKDECLGTLAEYSDILDVFMADGQPAPLEQWAVPRALRGETVTDAEYALRRKDTGETWVGSYSFGPIRDEKGAIVGSVVVGRDITERKAAQKRLEESERQLRLITETIPDMLWTGLADGFIDYCNHGWLNFTGMTQTEIQGNGWMKALHPEDVEQTSLVWAEACRRGGRYEVEQRLRSADGEYRWFLTRAYPLKDDEGRVIKWYGANTDITKLKEAEETLRSSEKHFRMALNFAKAGTWEWNLKTNENHWSEELWSLYGLEPHSCEASYEAWRQTIHPDDRENVERSVQEASARGIELRAEWRVKDPNGGERWLMSRGQPVCDDHGAPVSYIGVVIDITERKQSEIELQRSHREKVALLKEVHHRVKNNLQVVASLVGLQTYCIKSQEALDILKDTRNRVCSMALLHEVLYRSKDLARIGFSSYLHDLCKHILTSFGGAVERIKVEIRAEDIGMPMDKAVPCGLLVNELVSNALKHAFPGDRSGSVVVELAHSSEEMLRLKIQDDGVGLPSHLDLQNLPTLGLQLVYDLAHQLLGHVTVSSSPGGGTVFSVAFPLVEEGHRGGSE